MKAWLYIKETSNEIYKTNPYADCFALKFSYPWYRIKLSFVRNYEFMKLSTQNVLFVNTALGTSVYIPFELNQLWT